MASAKQGENINPQNRVGVAAIIIQDRHQAAPRVSEILSEYGEIIVGRMGIPYLNRGVLVI